MVRFQGSDKVDPELSKKHYVEGILDLVKNTAVRQNDFDHKALTLLDALDQRGKAKEACSYLKQFLSGAKREKIHNWPGYLYTLLRAFDAETYSSMKMDQGSDRRRSRGEKRAEVKERRTREVDESVNETVSTDAPDAKSAPEVKSCKTLNQTAPEFAPGQPWTGKGAGANGMALTQNPVEFVPGTPWAGFEKLSGNAPEFVPGQMSYNGVSESAAHAASQEMIRNLPALGYAPNMHQFMPGAHPWHGPHQAKKGENGTQKRRGAGKADGKGGKTPGGSTPGKNRQNINGSTPKSAGAVPKAASPPLKHDITNSAANGDAPQKDDCGLQKEARSDCSKYVVTAASFAVVAGLFIWSRKK